MKLSRIMLIFWNLARNFLAVIGLCALLVGGYGAVLVAKTYNLPPRLFALKVFNKLGIGSTALAEWVTPAPVRPAELLFPPLDTSGWTGTGTREGQILPPFHYDRLGKPIPAAWVGRGVASLGTPAAGQIISVGDSKEFLAAIRRATAGDVITLRPGKYPIRSSSISLFSGGTLLRPITVRAEALGDVFLELDTLEGFMVNKPYWVFENLDIKGTGQVDSYCEHAFHVVGDGKGFVLRNSRIHEFNAMIKANWMNQGPKGGVFPNGALIEGNSFFNTRPRQTSNPVTFIDVVGADDWIIRGNLLADFEKAQGDHTSYGVFIKGNSSNGVIENNLVIGEYRTSGGVRVGLSLGGGGTGAQFSRHGSNKIEHTGGIVRNNIVMYCSDVGLYLNKARETRVLNNTFYRTLGIDVRFPESSAVIQNNLLTGRIRNRDGGVSVLNNNLVGDSNWLPAFISAGFADWFVNPEHGDFTLKSGKKIVDKGASVADVREDFCGSPRDENPDIGAFEYATSGITRCLPFGKKE